MSDADFLPDDDDRFDSRMESAPRTKISPVVWVVGILAGVVILGLIVCCGGGYFLFSFGNDVLTEQIRADLEDNAVIEEHIGNVSSFEMDFTKSAAADVDEFVFRLDGDKGSGFLTVESITIDEDTEEVVEGSLKLDSGETIPLFRADDANLEDDTAADEGSGE